jgi:S-adenosylmethionine hydrolase
MSPPVITFLSDYGLTDGFVGVCHGVIAGICPDARVIDLTHGIERHDVQTGALTLADALPYMPAGVHLAVVDPGVGGERRAVALRTSDRRLLVGPDNGLLAPAAETAGGVVQAADIADSRFRLEPGSATFHGRDIFAPVAASLAAGASLEEAGRLFDPAQLVALELSHIRRENGELVIHVVHVDRFGNLALDLPPDDLRRRGVKLADRVVLSPKRGVRLDVPFTRTFAEVAAGHLLLLEDSAGRLALAVNQGSAAERLGLRVGDDLRLSAP